NANGDIFFVTNTQANIELDGVEIVNNDTSGIFLRASAAGWGSDGSNGGQVNLNATNQDIDGDMIVDEVSKLNLYLSENSSYTGAINSDGEAGEVYVELTDGATWTLTGDSYVTALTCDADSINLNGHTLYVDGVAYTEGTAVSGEAVEFTATSSGQGMPGDGQAPDGQAPDGQKPDGNGPSGDGNEPPAKPEGENGKKNN
ncbi:MAG: hypothetical protein II506_00395, partial [Lachnospiraceae bacterium]|nr:hypothetical protein [Lachnospiraceae bacterium]